ncbi:TolC family protein [Chitinophaga pinensis]|uniref:Outer membrane efflux protein n=1 Tax=Chitinophaga pinensis (strain ATCC 43595 / DSM 2588 / LMG 13176 / NBRC 15968 / NCIMB 11800 / UQM 2034) TaxID=485918 RepID=A0A979GBV2_CHIPD|nr:TolC family protein [Chitinophaga pinensis]ACU64601.1 outer membrane efflux protein [Chitinophaga pinensis DSM 2588]
MKRAIVLAVATLALSCMGIVATAQTNYTLSAALDTARTSSPVLKARYMNINAAQADVITARLRPNPNLNNQTMQLVSSDHFAPGTRWSSNQNRQVWYQLTKPVQWPNQRKYKIETADKDVTLANNTYEEDVRNLSLNVGSSWINCWVLKKRLALLNESRTNLDTLVKINELRYKDQVISQTDLTRTKVLLSQYDLQLSVFTQDYQNELHTLQLLTGNTTPMEIDTSNEILTFVPSLTLDSLIAQTMDNRSDVILAKNTIDERASNAKYQRSLAVPQPELGVIYNPQNAVPYIGFYGAIDLPFFNRNQGEIKKAQIQQQQAQQELSATQRQAQTEVVTAYNTYQLQQKNIEKYSGILHQSQQILDNVKYAYLRGGTSIIDFLDAQRNWYDTRLLYYDSLQAYYQSYIQLLFATGLINQL